MFASLLTNFADWNFLLTSPVWLAVTAFQVWMLVDAIRQREWIWALFILFGWGLSSILYYFFVYRAAPSATRGFELPGAHSRRRIKELQGQIYHLDKAHHHSQLGDIYFQQGKLDRAEACYRAAMERASPATLIPVPIWVIASCAKNAPLTPARCWKGSCARNPSTITGIP